jgi:hypothetical protein
VVKRHLGKDNAEIMQDRTEHMHGILGMIGTSEASTLCFAVESDADAALRIALRRTGRGEASGESDGERQGIEVAEEALQRGLMRRDASGEAEGGKDSRRLTPAPLSDGEDRQVIGQKRGHREGKNGGKGEAATVRATRVGDACKGSAQVKR